MKQRSNTDIPRGQLEVRLRLCHYDLGVRLDWMKEGGSLQRHGEVVSG